MRFNKVIYIRYLPLTNKVFSDFYMEEVSNSGIQVEYWDITDLFFKNKKSILEDSSNLTNTIKFKSYSQIEESLRQVKSQSKTLFVSIMSLERRVLKLYKLFTKYDCALSVFGRNMFPVEPRNSNILFLLKKINLSNIYNYILNKRFSYLKGKGIIKNYDIIFIGGNLGWKGIGMISYDDVCRAEVIKVNSDDYDNYLLFKNCQNIINEDYILFLDEYLPLHPDTVLFDEKNIKPEDYYPELNDYFNRVEKQFGVPVVIAAHPKAIRYLSEDFFNGRKVFFNQTAQLTKDALFVLAHDTTSINYPIAFGKKLHFITSRNIMNNMVQIHRNILYFSDFLGCNFQYFDNLNEKINLVDELPIEKYKSYKYEFQTSRETEYMLTSEIFLNFLNNI